MSHKLGNNSIYFKDHLQRHSWRELALFLILTFGLSYGLNISLSISVDYGASLATVALLQVQMLIPGVVAVCLGLFVVSGCRFYIRGDQPYRGRALLFLYAFLIYALLFSTLAIWMRLEPHRVTELSAWNSTLTSIFLLWLVFVRLTSTSGEFSSIGLGGGRAWMWGVGGIGVVIYHSLSAWLNHLLGLGTRVDLAQELAAMGYRAQFTGDLDTFQWLLFVQTVVIGSLVNLGFGFSEQFGWRGMVQDVLMSFGRRRGALFVAFLSAMCAWPVVGIEYSSMYDSLKAILVYTGLALPWGIFLSYVVLKTGSVWFAGFIQVINQQASAYFTGFFIRPDNPVLAWGVGLPALVPLVLMVVWLFRDPVWTPQTK